MKRFFKLMVIGAMVLAPFAGCGLVGGSSTIVEDPSVKVPKKGSEEWKKEMQMRRTLSTLPPEEAKKLYEKSLEAEPQK